MAIEQAIIRLIKPSTLIREYHFTIIQQSFFHPQLSKEASSFPLEMHHSYYKSLPLLLQLKRLYLFQVSSRFNLSISLLTLCGACCLQGLYQSKIDSMPLCLHNLSFSYGSVRNGMNIHLQHFLMDVSISVSTYCFDSEALVQNGCGLF